MELEVEKQVVVVEVVEEVVVMEVVVEVEVLVCVSWWKWNFNFPMVVSEFTGKTLSPPPPSRSLSLTLLSLFSLRLLL